MRLFAILTLVATLSSCSEYYHIKRAEKHTQKAILKGATIERDTTFITKSDTITEIDTVDNYIRITKIVTDTVYSAPKVVYVAKSRTEVRQENKTKRKEIKQTAKTNRKNNKQREVTKRKEAKKCNKFGLFFVGLLIGWLSMLAIVIYLYITRRNH